MHTGLGATDFLPEACESVMYRMMFSKKCAAADAAAAMTPQVATAIGTGVETSMSWAELAQAQALADAAAVAEANNLPLIATTPVGTPDPQVWQDVTTSVLDRPVIVNGQAVVTDPGLYGVAARLGVGGVAVLLGFLFLATRRR